MSNEIMKKRIQFGIAKWEQTRNKLITLATPDVFSQFEPVYFVPSQAPYDEKPPVAQKPVAQEVCCTAHVYQVESPLTEAIEQSLPPMEAAIEQSLPPMEAPPIEEAPLETLQQEQEPLDALKDPPLDPDMQLQEPWSQELLEQYALLPLPPFYDTMVQQEKVASELRRQNVQAQQHAAATAGALSDIEEQLVEVDTSLNTLKESMQEIRDLLQDSQQEEAQELMDEDDALAFSMTPTPARSHQDARFVHLLERLEQRLGTTVSPEACLMDSLDALFQLLQATEKMAGDIMSLVPFTTGFLKSSKPNWRIQLEKILESHLEGMMIVRNKLLIALTELGITIIDAAPGDTFVPELHKAVERIPNQEHAGQISQLIRYGYMKDNIPLRYATVAVFY